MPESLVTLSRNTQVTGDTPGIDARAIALAPELGFSVVAMKKNRADAKRPSGGELERS